MAATSSLSVEIWQTILRYAISVPDFLDADAFTGVLSKRQFHGTSRLNDEDVYWRAERARNQMQLVSKSWDSYLRRFEHRFIHMLDIRHKRIAAQKLEMAIRVSFGTCQCRCSEFCSDGDFLHHTLGTVDTERLEILDMAHTTWEQSQRLMPAEFNLLLLPNSQGFRNVKTLITPRFNFASRLTLLVRALPSLRHFYGGIYFGKSDLDGHRGLASPNLTTLAFSIGPFGGYDPINMNFPSLRHLRVDTSEQMDSVYVKSVVLNILRVTGRQLHSFQLRYTHKDEPLEEVWDLCPRMESFRTPFSLSSPPPFTHPIHTLLIHRVEQLEGLDPYSEWPNLRKIILGCKWADVDYKVREAYVPLKDSLRVDDWEGLSLDDYCQQYLAWHNPG